MIIDLEFALVLKEDTDTYSMELNLSPKFAQKIFEGEGGTYHSWSSSEYELLKQAKVGGGRFLLHPRGFAFPHYADCDKIGYVLEGICILIIK